MLKKFTIYDIVIFSLMTAILFIVQIALAFIPNIELVSLLIILYTIFFGYKTLIIIYAFVFLQGIYYGFGLWWINYTYVWTILFFIVIIFRKEKSSVFWAIISGLYGLSFGALCAVLYFFIGDSKTVLAYWVSGLVFDINHCIGNFFLAIFLFKPLYYVFGKLLYKNI